MKRVLILFGHPRFEQSRVNRALLAALAGEGHVTIQDLYELYPDFNIDVDREKALLLEHDIVAWQHPLYMYSAPALVKQWIDMVLEFGWAHGAGAENLKGKLALNTVTAGGTRQSYGPGGFNRYTLGEFLRPFEQTARLCGMHYLPPFGVQGTYRLDDDALSTHAAEYRDLLERLSRPGLDLGEVLAYPYLNDWIAAGRKGAS
jgi:glutathione-regulated potassium-efflux system ancillary protein KefG